MYKETIPLTGETKYDGTVLASVGEKGVIWWTVQSGGIIKENHLSNKELINELKRMRELEPIPHGDIIREVLKQYTVKKVLLNVMLPFKVNFVLPLLHVGGDDIIYHIDVMEDDEDGLSAVEVKLADKDVVIFDIKEEDYE